MSVSRLSLRLIGRYGAIVLGLLALTLVLGSALTPVSAQCPGTLMVNGGLEDGYSTRGAGEVEVANGWFPWYQDGPRVEEGFFKRPEWKPENAMIFGMRRVHSGNFAQKWFTTYGTHNAGIYQQVNVPAGSTFTASAWVQSWSSDTGDLDVSQGNYLTYIGIDPTGAPMRWPALSSGHRLTGSRTGGSRSACRHRPRAASSRCSCGVNPSSATSITMPT